ncbi:MAG: glucose-1-phosphate adenylyltransferase [Armatimonadetes bacterium]|nr:glucose-1-phosphate adenylyltransferase [Armatimonadota bacterium]
MKLPRVLTLVLAGGEGNRMGALTEKRAKPALRFGGVYSLIDFPLSNCAHSGLENIWVVEQFQAHSLNHHLANGRPWDLDRTYGGLQILPPQQGERESDWHQGNADALWRNRRFLAEFGADLILVLSADAVYRFDYRDAIQSHLERGAHVTMVTAQVEKEEASRFGNVKITPKGRVTKFEYKPENPISRDVTCEIFVYDAKILLQTLDELAKRTGNPPEEAELGDFGDELLPELVASGKAFAHPIGGYWRDVGTVESYFEAHQDWLQSVPPFELDDPQWPIWSHFKPRSSARFEGEGYALNSLISPGCRIAGEVKNSILSPGVVVEAGARVDEAILLGDVTVKSGVMVRRAVVDENQTVKKSVDGGEKITVIGG